MVRQLGNGLFNGTGRQLGVEFDQRQAQIAHQHHITLAGAAQRTARAKGFLIPGVGAIPAQNLFQMCRKGGLYQTVFTVDVGIGHVFYWFSDWLEFGALVRGELPNTLGKRVRYQG